MSNEIPELETLCKEGLQVAESKDLRKIMFFARKALRKLENIESWAEEEDFKENLKKYPQWLAKEQYEGEYLIVGIKKIDWDKEVIEWHNIDFDKRYPYGSSTFCSFMDAFIPA